jgi:hypothetical protein
VSPEPIDPIDECVRLGNLLAQEREWVSALTRDNGILLEAADATKAGALAVSQAGRIEHLERENAALRADKERYEWLKDGCGSAWAYRYLRNNFRINDDAIDAARKEQP